MRAYYGSRFSPNQTATPEGFLICHNVPVARTGWYEYLGEEIGADDQAGKIVRVFRSPEEVFSPAAIASFEGKVLTDEHPPDLVTPDNATLYARGAVQNVRQGSGEESDLLIADLVVYDQTLIREIQDGKREVSAGYECVYEPQSDGTYQQKQIRGNHVAVVRSGRAGDRVAIKDSKSTKGETKMPKVNLPGKKSGMTAFLAALGLKQLATDAEPEDIMNAMCAMAQEQGNGDEPAKDADPEVEALKAQVAQLTEAVQKLLQGKATDEDPKPEDAIDEAIAELQKTDDDGDEEESHTVPASSMDDEGPVSPESERPDSALTGDNAYKIQALRAMKPILAAIKDPAERKRAADAAIASIKGKPAQNTYAAIKPKKPAADKAPSAAADQSQLGRDIAKRYNPHYKDRA